MSTVWYIMTVKIAGWDGGTAASFHMTTINTLMDGPGHRMVIVQQWSAGHL